MRIQRLGVIVFALSSAALAFGQSTTPTGIQKAGVISLLRAESKITVGTMPPIESTTDNASGAFVSSDYTNYTPPPVSGTMIGPCFVTTLTLPLTPPQYTPPTTTFLDAGPVINVSGPNGTKQIPQMKGAYFLMVGGGVSIPTPFPIPGLPGVLPPYLDPGTYTVDNGGGGADVGSFTVTLNVPSPGLTWTNADSDLTVSLAAGVDVQWSGGDPTTNVQIQGVSTSSTMSGSFTCVVPNNGEFMVTPDVLAALPPSGTAPGGNTLTVSNASMANFSASGIDTGLLIYESGSSRTVVYQ
jgi:hypothetical protein